MVVQNYSATLPVCHCEQSEAISPLKIATSLTLLAMTNKEPL
ncbi:MAG: hypothetical protein WC855_13760 [Thermodesulfovibrionales bacterium]